MTGLESKRVSARFVKSGQDSEQMLKKTNENRKRWVVLAPGIYFTFIAVLIKIILCLYHMICILEKTFDDNQAVDFCKIPHPKNGIIQLIYTDNYTF